MKNKLYLIAFLLILISGRMCEAQAPNWEWAKSGESSGNDGSQSICTDKAGNIYITGWFESSNVIFGTDTLVNADASGSRDIFITKYDHNGNVIWAKGQGGINDDVGLNIVTDDSGYVYLTGRFGSPSILFGTTLLTNNGIIDMYIVKYDSTGNVVWAKSAGGTKDDEGLGVTCDHFGNVYVTGYFWSPSITFGSNILTNVSVSDTTDVFIVKYDSNGNCIWSQSAGGNRNDAGWKITSDSIGNIYMTGSFRSSFINFGTTTLYNVGNNNQGDILVVKFDSSGNVIWAKSVGGYGVDVASSIAVDVNGNVYVSGNFESDSISFGGQLFYNASEDYDDIIILKYDLNGNELWAKTFGGPNVDGVSCLSLDDGGKIYITGYFYYDTISFGPITLINNGISDVYISKLDSNGNVLWAESAGGSTWDSGAGCTTDINGDIYLTGVFYNNISFGTNILNNVNNYDVFIAKLGRNTGVNEFPSNSSVLIYPNPFTSQTTISFSEAQTNTTIKIRDVLGNTVNSLKASGKSITLDMSGVAKGIYFVEITDGSANSPTVRNVVNKKIIIQ